MKIAISWLSIIIALLFICYRLLFIFLDISSIHMVSDADINNAGKMFLLFCPIIFIGGIWVTYRTFCISSGKEKYKNYITALLSLYGGLFGVVIVDTAMHSVSIEIEDYFTINGIFALSFLIFSIITFFIAKNHLTKSSSGR